MPRLDMLTDTAADTQRNEFADSIPLADTAGHWSRHGRRPAKRNRSWEKAHRPYRYVNVPLELREQVLALAEHLSVTADEVARARGERDGEHQVEERRTDVRRHVEQACLDGARLQCELEDADREEECRVFEQQDEFAHHRRQDVGVADHRAFAGTGGNPGSLDDERDPGYLVVHGGPLVGEAVGAEHVTVVGGVDDPGVPARLPRCVEDAPGLGVHEAVAPEVRVKL